MLVRQRAHGDREVKTKKKIIKRDDKKRDKRILTLRHYKHIAADHGVDRIGKKYINERRMRQENAATIRTTINYSRQRSL